MHSIPCPADASRIRYGRKHPSVYLSESDQRILRLAESDSGDPALRPSLHFSTGVVERIERQLCLGCAIIADSNLVQSGIDRGLAGQFPVRLQCFMDDPMVLSFATLKRVTRAEVAIEHTLSIEGPKLIVVGSAPMALSRLLQLHRQAPLPDVTVIAAAAGFASAVEMKERIWESGLPCIVIRGHKGGANAAIAVVNALLRDAAQQKI